MKRTILGALTAVLLISSGALAQDYFHPFNAYKDHLIAHSLNDPCRGAGLLGAASVAVYETTLVMAFTCRDERVILRRFFRPNDQPPLPPLVPVPMCVGNSPRAGWICVQGNWLPPDHPNAR